VLDGGTYQVLHWMNQSQVALPLAEPVHLFESSSDLCRRLEQEDDIERRYAFAREMATRACKID
jgi:hypothetical protein